jgi:putative ABC transport system ATP-binding protein
VSPSRALVTEPTVLFADEPTGNLDSKSSHEVLELLRDAAGSFGQTTVMVTHDPGAAAYADRVVLLADGKVAGEIEHPDHASVTEALRSLAAQR